MIDEEPLATLDVERPHDRRAVAPRTREGRPDAAGGPHLDENAVAGWIDGALCAADAASARAHLDACTRCAAAVLDVQRSLRAPAVHDGRSAALLAERVARQLDSRGAS